MPFMDTGQQAVGEKLVMILQRRCYCQRREKREKGILILKEESSTDSEAGVMSDSTGESPAIRSPTPLPLPPSPLPATPGPPSVSVSEGATSETPRTPSRQMQRKRGHDQSAIVAALHEMQAEDRQQQDLDRIQRDKHLDRLLTEAREAREHEDAIRRETAAFNQSFLAVLGKLAEAIGRQHH
ncbi:hypothetical protein WMY93_023051 [Mugilogobius chulae]|uniref:Uncharacterized protein n=1 Tax=Mugilogobius chulae TaxID=88201 RepID=A0AAW0N387_9GOBI